MLVRLIDGKGAKEVAVPGVRVGVFVQRGSEAKLISCGSAKTALDGTALFGALPAGIVLVVVGRSDMSCEQTSALQLTEGKLNQVDIRLKEGGCLTGRLIDDAQRALAGVEVRVQQVLGGFSSKTDADGRFKIDRVMSQPRAFSVVDGLPHSTRLQPVLVRYRVQAGVAKEYNVADGETKDIGDIIVPRESRLLGRVLTADGRPVAGALVSMNGNREGALEDDTDPGISAKQKRRYRLGPASDDFHLESDETITDEAGQFELRRSRDVWYASWDCAARCADDWRDPIYLLVWTRDGQIQFFEVPGVPDGGRATGIELVLDESTVLHLDLGTPSGAVAEPLGRAIDQSSGAIRNEESPLASLIPWADGTIPWSDAGSVWLAGGDSEELRGLNVTVFLRDGRRLSQHGLARGPGGQYLCQFPCPAPSIDVVQVMLGGYLPVRDDVRGSLQSGDLLSYQVRPLPSLKLRVHLDLPSGRAALGCVSVHACLFSPDKSPSWQRCCGRGSFAYVDLSTAGVPVVEKMIRLPVLTERPFWVYFTAGDASEGAGDEDTQAFGPFPPDDAIHDVVLPGDVFSWEPAAPETEETPGPVGFLSAKVLDARTGDTLSLHYDECPKIQLTAAGERRFTVVADFYYLSVVRQPVPAGSWMGRVQAPGYVESTPIPVEIMAGEDLDLGEITLEPAPQFSGQLLPCSGSWIGEGVCCVAMVEGQSESEYDMANDGGLWIPLPLPASFWIRFVFRAAITDGVNRMDERVEMAAQSFHVERWSPGEIQVFRLHPWRLVHLRLTGMTSADSRSPLRVFLRESEDDLPADWTHEGTEIDAAADGTRSFLFAVCAGGYRVLVDSILCDLPATEIDVREEPLSQVFDLRLVVR